MDLAGRLAALISAVGADIKTLNTGKAAVGLVGASGLTAAPGVVLGRSTASTGAVESLVISGGLVAPAGAAQLYDLLSKGLAGYWVPAAGSATVPGILGYPAVTATGTATARAPATTNYFTRQARIGYVSAATAAALAGPRIATATVTLGVPGTPNVGGFRKVVVFGCSDAATVSGARQFVGVGSTAAPANVEPSTLVNSIGVGHGAADTNLKIFYGGSVAQTPLDLGANFPANTLSVDMYELELYAAPASNNTVTYKVTRLNTGQVASGTLTAATPGTQLPANTTLLSAQQAWRSNNATALAVGLDFCSDFIGRER